MTVPHGADRHSSERAGRALVLGANGFIGSAVVAALQRSGIRVRCVVRDTARFRRRFPHAEACALDLTDAQAHDVGHWTALLAGVDAVVNVAGVLQPRTESEAWDVHKVAPDALYAACEKAGTRRVVHVSAIGIQETDTAYAASKRAGEDCLMSRDLDWTVLRPVLVIGDDSYGGTSLVRALAAFPFLVPVIDTGATPVEIIHKDDLADGVARLILDTGAVREVLEPAAPGRLTLLELITAYREWLGLRKGHVWRLPMWLAKYVARIGDVTGMPPVTTTALTQLGTRLTGDGARFQQATGVAPRSLTAVLSDRPSGSQDLWHARLFLLRPLVRVALAILWAVSGVVGLLANAAAYDSVAATLGNAAKPLTTGFSLFDLAIAAALVRGWRLKLMADVQLALVLAYTIGLGLMAPELWSDPFGGLLKNLPILVLVLVHRVLEEER